MVVSLSNSTRRDRAHHHGGRKSRQTQGLFAGSQSDVQRCLRLTPLVCEQPTCSQCMCVARLCTVLPRSRTGRVGVTSPRQTVDGRCSQRSFLAVVVVSDVERPVPVDVFPSYVSIPDPRCRGTRLGRSRWASRTRTKSILLKTKHARPPVLSRQTPWVVVSRAIGRLSPTQGRHPVGSRGSLVLCPPCVLRSMVTALIVPHGPV